MRKPFVKNACNILVSYAYCRNRFGFIEYLKSLVNENRINLLLDSGAFTSFTRGKEINLKEYIDFCREMESHCVNYIQLDKIRDDKVSKENLEIMFQSGLTPMPVITAHEKDLLTLSTYANACGYACVAGGGGSSVTDWVISRFININKVIPNVKLHGLAFVKYPAILKLPIYSCDSSTWGNASRFGHISAFEKAVGFKSLSTYNKLSQKKYLTSQYYDYTKAMNENDVRNTYCYTTPETLTCIRAYCMLSKTIKFYNKEYFFACTAKEQVIQCLYSYENLHSNSYIEVRDKIYEGIQSFKSGVL